MYKLGHLLFWWKSRRISFARRPMFSGMLVSKFLAVRGPREQILLPRNRSNSLQKIECETEEVQHKHKGLINVIYQHLILSAKSMTLACSQWVMSACFPDIIWELLTNFNFHLIVNESYLLKSWIIVVVLPQYPI